MPNLRQNRDMTSTKDKQLLKVDAEEAKQIAAEGGALNLRQLAVVANYSYESIRIIARQPGFPILAGKVTLDDYKLWRQRRLGLIPPLPELSVVDAGRARPSHRR